MREWVASGGEVMGLNWAHLNPALSEIPLTLYLSADRRMVEESDESHKLRHYLKTHKDLLAFVPEIRIMRWQEILPGINFYVFCRFYIKYLRPPWWGLQPHYPKAFTSQTGLHALQISTWLGYKAIYLVGFDNSYFREFTRTKGGGIVKEISHAGEGVQTHQSEIDTATYLEIQASLFRDYWKFSHKNIWNLDPHSPTDAFPKVDFSTVLKELNQKLGK